MLEKAGYEIVPFAPGADVYVINTCTVTNIADRKSRQMLHKARRMNPDAIVVAAGCYVQTDQEKVLADEAIDLVLGNNRKGNLIEALEEFERERKKKADIIRINQTHDYEDLSVEKTAEHVRAFIKVQDGCNQFCTYCIIPYARGRVRSRRPEEVEKEIRALAEEGYREVVLTGIHLSSYGTDFPDGTDLLSLITLVHGIPGIERIRLGSLEPGIITEEFVQSLAALPKVCPHFHLSLQSGCEATLRRMNRRYHAEEYREKCALLRRYYELPAITTDVITGFPMEDEQEFEESRRFIEEISFYETHVFPYSRRKGTKAAAMEGQLSEAVKKQRSDVLLALNEEKSRAFEEAMIGRTLSVLLEEQVELCGQVVFTGHSREYVTVAVPAGEGLHQNMIVDVVPDRFIAPHILFADLTA